MDEQVAGQRVLCKAGRECSLPASLHIPSIFFVLLAALIAFSGCSRQDDGAPTPVSRQASGQASFPGIRNITIVPNPMVRTTPLTVSIEKDGAQGVTASYQYQWFLNKIAVQGATGSSFDASTLRRGDRIHVVVTIPDATRGGASFQSSPVAVPNVPPVIKSIVLEQHLTSAGSRLSAKVDAFDADQDNIQFEFRWLRNDKVVLEGSESTVALPEVAQNDMVTVEATPYDRDGAGTPMRATPLVVGNNAPKILSTPMMMASAEGYEYEVRAQDPDGDTVSFELEHAPSGMTIDRAAGRVVWKPGTGTSGTHHVKIIAADGKGARVWQEFDLSIPPPSQSQ